MWVYQEIIHEVKPDVIIETGTMDGGSALFMASSRPQHDRITYLLGSSTSEEIVHRVRGLINGQEKVLVVLDSDHRMEHVLQELQIYSQMVTLGSYMIVEDTNMNGHPVAPEFGPGPMEAVQEFLKDSDAFEIDKRLEKFYLTFNPNGFLRKVG